MFVFIDNGACWAHTFHAKWWLMRCCRALKPSAPSCWCSLPSLLSSAAAPSSSTTSGSGTPALQQMLWRTAQAMIALHAAPGPSCIAPPDLWRHLFEMNLLIEAKTKYRSRHFADYSFKYISLNENVLTSIKISLKFIHTGPIAHVSALVQIMD